MFGGVGGLGDRLAFVVDANVDSFIRGMHKAGDSAEKEMGKAQSSFDKTSKNAIRMGTGIAGAGAVALVGLGKLVKMSEGADLSTLKLSNSIANNANLAGESTDEYTKLAGAIMRKTAADDDDIIAGEAVLAQSKLMKNQILELTPLMVDLARKRGIDMPAASMALVKAENGNIGALQRMGITVDAATFAVDRHRAIIDALRASVGGFAEEEGATFAGTMARLGNELHNIGEEAGKGAAEAFEHMLAPVISLTSWLEQLNPNIVSTAGGLATYAAAAAVAVGGTTALVGWGMKAKKTWSEFAATTSMSASTLAGLKTGLGVAGAAAVGAAAGIEIWSARMRQAEQDVEDFRNKVDGAFTSATSLDDFNQKLAATREQITALSEKRAGSSAPWDADYRAELSKGIDSLTALSDKYSAVGAEAEQMAAQLGISDDAALKLALGQHDAADAAAASGQAFDAQASAADQLTQAMSDLVKGIDEYYGKTTSVLEANVSVEQSLDDLAAKLKENKRTFDINTQAGRDNIDAIIGVRDAAIKAGEAVLDSGGSAQQAADAVNTYTSRLHDTMIQAGYTEDQVRTLLDQMGLTPDKVNTEFVTNAADATAAAALVNSQLNQADRTVHSNIIVTTTYFTVGGGAGGGGGGIGAHAAGGSMGPYEVSTVGEAGTELFVAPKTGGYVVSHADAMRAITPDNGASGSSLTIQILAPVYGVDDLRRVVTQAVDAAVDGGWRPSQRTVAAFSG